jgi:2,5-diketo-D-gluconate reductase A
MQIDARIELATKRTMPVLGVGTWQLTDDTAATLEHALRLGYRMIDTSGDYGTEAGLGDAIRWSRLDRAEIFVVTKVEKDEDAFASTWQSLRELRLDYVDLVLVQRPPRRGAGEALWEGLLRARDAGLARDIGVSNYSIDQIERLVEATGERPAVNQIEWSPFGWSPEMLEHCARHDVVIQAYSPLTRAERLDDERLTAVAADCGKTPAQVLLRWNLQHGTVPLPKANRREHLAENLDVFDFELSDEHLQQLGGLNERWSALGHALQYA